VHHRPLPTLLVAVLLSLATAACGAAEGDPVPTAAEDAGSATDDAADAAADDEAVEDPGPELRIVSTVAPIADLVEEVLGDRGEVHTLVPGGMDSHTYEPRPSDVVPLADADAFIGNGLDLNPAAVELAEANLPEDAPLVLLGEVALDESALTDEHWHAEDHGHTHGHGHDDDHDHDHDHGAGGVNPHTWTSVPNVIAYVATIEETLTALDPEGATGYTGRADELREQLAELDDAITSAVESLSADRRKLVVYHDAWTYFGRAYGVEVVAAVQPTDHAEPSASDVRAIIDQIRAEEVPAIFGAEEFPSSVAATIAEETGATYVGELADDTLPGEPGDPEHSYVGMMVANVSRIVDALGGDTSPLTALR
jgi:ABC-type Zn uptake system ZnuABC Zn-binding protein ZnuA